MVVVGWKGLRSAGEWGWILQLWDVEQALWLQPFPAA